MARAVGIRNLGQLDGDYCWKREKPLSLSVMCFSFILYCNAVGTTSINYGISQQPITDSNQLMPKLCQNQSVICEGSFCIPGVRKCVCDLRMPVQFGRFCLRQVDIETKCFVTNQCNHTIKDAVCIDMNANAILDIESSKFKLEQWQNLAELRQASRSALANENIIKQIAATGSTTEHPKPMFLMAGEDDSNTFTFKAKDDVHVSNARTSPYEINYNTPELLQQNHTRRRTNHVANILNSQNSDSTLLKNNESRNDGRPYQPVASTNAATNNLDQQSAVRSPTLETSTIDSGIVSTSTVEVPVKSSENDLSYTTTILSTTAGNEESPRKKMITKTPNWPPGICSCPFGFMFDSMLRKCLALSLADSHCQTDNDCRQISMSHCGGETKKCECDEPLVWSPNDLACARPRPTAKTTSHQTNQTKEGFVENLIPPLVLAKLLPDQIIVLLIFVIIVIIATLVMLRLTIRCFSSSNSALISPKNHKGRKPLTGNLPPRSPYATLKRADQKPNSQLSNFTQAARGRILNYDFEQDGGSTIDPRLSTKSPQPSTSGTMKSVKDAQAAGIEKDEASTATKGHKHLTQNQAEQSLIRELHNGVDQLMELNDNVSVSQLESESKSDNSVTTIPGPPSTQPPPYMLASAMKGQGSAIAAAAAAVANRRMQMAQKKSQDQQNSNTIANGRPVFL